jgi:flagellar hook-associated protein 2
VTRPSNTVSDLIPGVTLSLSTKTEGAARIDLSRDTQSVKQNIQGLVQAYNDLDLSLGILSDPKSEVEGLGGSLAGDALIRTIRNTVRGILSANSRTPGTELKAARDVGLSFDRDGKLTLNQARLDTALADNYEDVVRIFSAGTNNKSLYNSNAAGLAGDLVVSLDRMTRSTGLIARQNESASRDVDKYKRQLQTLEDRMASLLSRYTKQFGTMESIVGSSKDIRGSLKSSFEGMMSSYKK